jgi:hypothetical protein
MLLKDFIDDMLRQVVESSGDIGTVEVDCIVRYSGVYSDPVVEIAPYDKKDLSSGEARLTFRAETYKIYKEIELGKKEQEKE